MVSNFSHQGMVISTLVTLTSCSPLKTRYWYRRHRLLAQSFSFSIKSPVRSFLVILDDVAKFLEFSNNSSGCTRAGRPSKEFPRPGDLLLQKSCQVKRKFIFMHILMERSTSGSSTILQRISSRRAKKSTNFTIKY